MKIDDELLERFKGHNELLKHLREMAPKKIAEAICSVQPMDGVDLLAVADALENYKWATPHCRMGMPYNEEDDK